MNIHLAQNYYLFAGYLKIELIKQGIDVLKIIMIIYLKQNVINYIGKNRQKLKPTNRMLTK